MAVKKNNNNNNTIIKINKTLHYKLYNIRHNITLIIYFIILLCLL